MSVLHRSSVEPDSYPLASPPSAPSASPLNGAEPTTPIPQPAARSRLGSVWAGLWAAAVLAILLIIFMVQNTRDTRVAYFGLSGTTSLSVALLIAAVGGIVLTLLVGTARLTQLRRRAQRSLRRVARSDDRRSDRNE